jgi:hypothetical protein
MAEVEVLAVPAHADATSAYVESITQLEQQQHQSQIEKSTDIAAAAAAASPEQAAPALHAHISGDGIPATGLVVTTTADSAAAAVSDLEGVCAADPRTAARPADVVLIESQLTILAILVFLILVSWRRYGSIIVSKAHTCSTCSATNASQKHTTAQSRSL